MAERIVLFAESGDSWHVGRLVRAFRGAGVEPHVVSLQTVDVAVGPGSWGLRIPGLGDGPPDAAVVRTVAGGGFEPVTLRLDVLHALTHLGVPTINGVRAIERCVDKAMTSFLLHRAGIPTPETWATENPDRATAILHRALEAGETLVQKPLFGSQGRDVRRLERGDALAAADGVFYLQRYVAGGGTDFRDWRVFVVGNRAVAAMARIAGDWVTNVRRGARCEAVHGDGELEAMAVAAAAAVVRHPLLKMKLTGEGDRDRVAAVRAAAPGARLVVDANEGWTLEQLRSFAPALAELGVEMIEQPLPAGADEALRGYSGPVPLGADESCHGLDGLARLRGLYDVVNIKLDKTGGLTEALAMRAAAEAAGFAVMVGCMVATSLAMAPAVLLAQGARYVDLDGPLLLAGDRTPGLRYEGALVHPPEPALWG